MHGVRALSGEAVVMRRAIDRALEFAAGAIVGAVLAGSLLP
jgi:hypothetical protein